MVRSSWDGKWFFIDKEGIAVHKAKNKKTKDIPIGISFRYAGLNSFSEGLASVKKMANGDSLTGVVKRSSLVNTPMLAAIAKV